MSRVERTEAGFVVDADGALRRTTYTGAPRVSEDTGIGEAGEETEEGKVGREIPDR